MNALRWVFERFGMPPELPPDEGLAILHQLLDAWGLEPDPPEPAE